MPSATPSSSTPRIVLGVAGGIAAYKSVELLRLLRDRGYHVAPRAHARRHPFRWRRDVFGLGQ